MRKKQNRLFSEFPEISTQEWENVIQKDLKGSDYAKRLIWKTDENFLVKPYYRVDDLNELDYLNQIPGKSSFAKEANVGNEWKIIQHITEPNLKNANALALNSVQKGANALFLNAKNIHTKEDICNLLDGIDLNTITIRFENHVSYPKLASLFLAYIEEKKIDKEAVQGSFDFDPIMFMLLHNKFHKSQQEDLSEIITMHQQIGEKLPLFQYITVNGNILHNCGASIIQELAYALAMGNEYLVFANDNGISIDDIAPKINFTFSIGSNYFMEIAKLRVARLLWATIVEQYQPSIAELTKIKINSISSSWNKTVYDANVNMLRTTTEGMAAAIGGADAILLSTYDETYKAENNFSSRIARNSQIILKEEAHFDKVNDPAAGSYYIENLTHSLADETWKLFLETENQKGIITLGLKGKIKETVEESCQKRNMDIATRRITLLGTNQYPNLNESMLDKIEEKETPIYEGLQPYRGAIAFEELRLATEQYAKKHGKPKIFLLKIGKIAMQQARAGFITNFFGCAGYEIIENPGYKTVEQGVKEALASNAQIVAICSSDEEYETYAAEIAKALKAKNPKLHCVIAGNPTDIIDMLKTAGVDDFIHVRLNLIETLNRYNKLLGI